MGELSGADMVGVWVYLGPFHGHIVVIAIIGDSPSVEVHIVNVVPRCGGEGRQREVEGIQVTLVAPKNVVVVDVGRLVVVGGEASGCGGRAMPVTVVMMVVMVLAAALGDGQVRDRRHLGRRRGLHLAVDALIALIYGLTSRRRSICSA